MLEFTRAAFKKWVNSREWGRQGMTGARRARNACGAPRAAWRNRNWQGGGALPTQQDALVLEVQVKTHAKPYFAAAVCNQNVV